MGYFRGNTDSWSLILSTRLNRLRYHSDAYPTQHAGLPLSRPGAFLRLGCALILCTGLFSLSGQAAEEGYYKWRDAKGRPQHSDRPPPSGVEYEFISTSTGMTRRVAADESNGREYGSSAPAMPQPTEEESNAAAQQAAIEKDPAVCDQAKANLDTLNSTARVRIRDDQGIRYLTDEEKDIQRQRASDLIAIHCN